ncbi:hypothetical protein ACHMW7_05775 [Aminobacter sp. UC22_36]|uniref:hypothetical protein n=1 Tax=Aminobacter sp. UC22_36 TaxID=3374549 RepID=UPI003756B081
MARFGRLEDVERGEFVGVLAKGELKALVRFPDKADNYRLPADSWRDQFFAERTLLADEIANPISGPWEAFAGRTPFIHEPEFQAWLEGFKGEARNRETTSGMCLRLAKDELIDAAFYGRVSPADALSLTEKWGLPPLDRRPNAASFDPMRQAKWTLAMTVAWIVWRTSEAVRDNWDSYRIECWEWRGHRSRLPVNGGSEWQEVEGWELRHQEPATLMRLGIVEAVEDPLKDGHEEIVSVASARKELWDRLAEGALIATGVPEATSRPVQVPAHEWAYLVATADKNLSDQLRFKDSPLKVEYREVMFSRDDVQRLWNQPTPKRSLPAASPMRVEHGAFMFLGEAIDWIICRGLPLPSQEFADRWDEAEQNLFAVLDTNVVTVQGYPAPNMLRVYEDLPLGIWARMNRGGSGDPMFSSVDDSEEREDGGSVFVGDQRWDGVRLPTTFVMRQWPTFPEGSGVDDAPRRRGRPARYDWAAFGAKALSLLEEEGDFDPAVDPNWNQSKLERLMADWCLERWGTQPSESVIRIRVKPVVVEYRRGRKG